jgi:hypothetical protein
MYHRDLTEETLPSQVNAGATRGDPFSGGTLPDFEETQTIGSSSIASSSGGGGGGDATSSNKRRHHASVDNHSCADATATSCGPPSCCRTSSSCHPHQPHRHVGDITDDALRHFEEAMTLIEPMVKQGYEIALGRCPAAVFQHECCPCYFLRACQSNPWDAAVRMCSYWTERIHLFEDRAFEPITLGSDVAPPTGLFPQDLKVLETGAVMLLPSDKDGRTVLLLDHSRLEPDMIEQYESRLRVIWYMFQAGYRSGEAQAHKLVTIVSMTRPPPSGQFSMGVWKYGVGAVRLATSQPIAVDAIHLLCLPVKFGTGRIVHLGLSVCATMLGNLFSTVTKVHHGQATAKHVVNASTAAGTLDEDVAAKPSLLQQLKPHGFTKSGIPDVAGGLYNYDSFLFWLRRQRRVERKVIWTEDQRTKQKRDVNRLHSQQKRQRRRQEFEELQEQVDRYTAANKQARVVQAQLENLLRAAHESVREATAAAAPTFDLGLPRATTTFPQYQTGGWDQRGVAPMLAQDTMAEISMSPSILAALEPDPIAPSCLPRLPMSTLHRDDSGATLAAATYQAFETWGALHSPSPSEHSSMREAESEPQDGMLLAQLQAMSPDQLRSIMPSAPERTLQFSLPMDGLGGPASLPRKFTVAGAGGTRRTPPPFQREMAGKLRTSVDRSESLAPGHVQPEMMMSREEKYQRQFLQGALKSSSRSGASAMHPSLLQPGPLSSEDKVGPLHRGSVMLPKDLTCAFRSRGQASNLPPGSADTTGLLDDFRSMLEPTTVPSTFQSSFSDGYHPSNMDFSDSERNAPCTPSFWPIDVLKDIRHDFSIDPSPLVDDTVFYDTLC